MNAAARTDKPRSREASGEATGEVADFERALTEPGGLVDDGGSGVTLSMPREDVLVYVASLADELADMASRADCEHLAILLHLASREARQQTG